MKSLVKNSVKTRETIIRELRHQLHYSDPGTEREAIRQLLDFWLYHQDGR